MPRRVKAAVPGLAAALGCMLSQMLFAPREAHAQATPAAPTTIAVGDWQLKPLVEVRTRAEYRRDAPDLGGFDLRGALGPRVRSAWDAAERSRLGLGVEHGAVRAQVTLQDARALGTSIASATLGPARAPAQVGAYEAYLEARTAAARGAMLRLGRQAVVWGEGRLVGDADFSPTGRSLDAARGHVAFGNVDVEALAVILEAPGPLGSSFAQRSGPSYSGVQLYGLMGRYTVDPLLRIELFAFARVARSSGEALDGSRFAIARSSGELYTGSLRISGEAKGWDHGIEGAYQLGTAASLAVGGSDVRAFALAGHLQKTLPEVRLTPTFRVSASYASGDDGRGTYTQFDPLLPDPQRFHGQMDLFAWSNAVDLAGRAQIVPWTDTSFGLEYRYARLARTGGEWVGSYLQTVGSSTPASGYGHAGYAPITGAASAELGHEIDVSFAWRPYVPLELRVGWSGLLLGDGARRIMAGMARGRTDAVNDVEAARIAQYAFAQATLAMP